MATTDRNETHTLGQVPYYRQVLQRELLDKQAKNSRYSLRAFARDLNLNPSTLSSVLQGKRPLPNDSIEDVIRGLKLDEFERPEFEKSVRIDSVNLGKISQYRDFEVVLDRSGPENRPFGLDWRYITIYVLSAIAERKDQGIKWMSQKLELPEEEVREVVDELAERGLLEKLAEDKVKKTSFYLALKGGDEELRRAERKADLEFAIKHSERLTMSDFFFRSSFVSVNATDVAIIQKLLVDFRYKVRGLLAENQDDKEEVYLYQTSFFPVTRRKE